ncbi:LysR family transcriptional regulator [Variovorax paradoxus]|nr:LysR family transcriptional regulator [Variovorax paradoxus]MBT2300754.1 LysR family transcriptional regulator [Variovorax paradoxus]
MDNLNALQVFARVAESRSFTLAAERLGLTPSAVSKSVSKLEAELGVRLLHRSTRLVSLTNDGASFFDRCRHILAEIEDAKSALTLSNSVPQGKLRVQMPVGFGRRVVAPALLRFTEQNPGLSVDVELSDRAADLAYEGFDLAIQIGPIADTRLVARHLCNLSFAAYASPAYLERHGEPATPDELDRHHCLAYIFPMTGNYRAWQFSKEGRTFAKIVSGGLNMNNAESLLEAAVAGAGITMISNFIAADALRRGQLKRILTDYVAKGPDVHAVYLPGRHLSAKVRIFIDFLLELVERFKQMEASIQQDPPRLQDAAG